MRQRAGTRRFQLNPVTLTTHWESNRDSDTAAANVPELPIDLLSQPRKLLHRRRCPWNADSFVLEWRGRRLVLKDFGSNSGILRQLWAAFVIRRESRFLAQADGIEGVPQPPRRIGACASLRPWLPGKPLGACAGESIEPEFFVRLSALLEALHQRGIAHGDLNRRNVLIDATGRPGLLDFECAVMSRPGSGLLLRWMFRIHAQADEYQLGRMKTVFAPQLLTSRERELTRRPSLVLRLALVWRDRWRV